MYDLLRLALKISQRSIFLFGLIFSVLPTAAHALSIQFSDGITQYASLTNNATTPLPPGITHPDLTPIDPLVPQNPFTVDPNNVEVISFSFNHPSYSIFGNIANFTNGSLYGVMISDFGVISRTAGLASGILTFQDGMGFPLPGIGDASIIGESLVGNHIFPDGTPLSDQANTTVFVRTDGAPASNANMGLVTTAFPHPYSASTSGGCCELPLPPVTGLLARGIVGELQFSISGLGTTIAIDRAEYWFNDAGNVFNSPSPHTQVISPWANGTFGVLGQGPIVGGPGKAKAPWALAPPWGAEGPPWGQNDVNPWGFPSNIPEPTIFALMSLGLAGIGYSRHRCRKAA